MYVNSKRIIRKFKVELTDDSETVKIHVLPPKLSMFEKIQKLNDDSDDFSLMKSMLLEILNRNDEKTVITEEFFENAVDIISFNALFSDIFDWIHDTEKK